MATLYMTRAEIIKDLPRAFREQNDMNDHDLAAVWIRFGIHAGTWDWDDVCVDRLYYNAEMGRVDMLSMFRDWQGEEMSREEFDAWAGEYLINIEYFADENSIDEIIRKFYEDEDKKIVFGDDEEKYLVVELDSEDTPEFPYIPDAIWNEIEAYDDLFAEIRTGQQMTLVAALVQLKLLRGNPIPEIGYPGHGFIGYDGMILREE